MVIYTWLVGYITNRLSVWSIGYLVVIYTWSVTWLASEYISCVDDLFATGLFVLSWKELLSTVCLSGCRSTNRLTEYLIGLPTDISLPEHGQQ